MIRRGAGGEVYQSVFHSTEKRYLECDKCAMEMKSWLDSNRIERKILKLRTKKRNDFFIISSRFSDNESITDNGIHYGVEVLGLVFDNLSYQGLPRNEVVDLF